MTFRSPDTIPVHHSVTSVGYIVLWAEVVLPQQQFHKFFIYMHWRKVLILEPWDAVMPVVWNRNRFLSFVSILLLHLRIRNEIIPRLLVIHLIYFVRFYPSHFGIQSIENIHTLMCNMSSWLLFWFCLRLCLFLFFPSLLRKVHSIVVQI